MDIPVTPVEPTLDEKPLHTSSFAHNKKLLAIIAVCAVVAMLIIALVTVKKGEGNIYGVKFFEGSYVSGKVVEPGLLGFSEETVRVNGVLSDYAEGNSVKVAIVTDSETASQDVFLIGGDGRQLTTDGAGKASVAVSPDGVYVAYAKRVQPVSDGAFDSHISAWSVVVLNVETGETTDFGQGFAPHFYVPEDGVLRVLFTTRTGVTSARVLDKSARSIDFINPGIIDFAATVSSDGKYLAVPNGLTKMYQIFSLTDSETDFSVKLLTVSQEPFINSAFVGPTLLGIARSEDGTATLWTVPVDSSKVQKAVRTLPANSLYRIIP